MSEPNVEVTSEDGVTTIRTGVTQDVGGEKVAFGGLYNMVLGDGHEAERGALLLSLISLGIGDFARYRDAWVETSPSGDVRIAVYTRLGGANRADYVEVIEALVANPFWIGDQDDDYDSTYATFYFQIPTLDEYVATHPDLAWDESMRERFEQIRNTIAGAAEPEPVNMSEKWQEAIAALKGEE